MKRVLILVFSLIFIMGVFSCGGSGNGNSEADSFTYQVPNETDDGLKTASLSDVSLDETVIIQGVKKILKDSLNDVLGLLIVKDGKLVLEEYFEGYDRNTLCEVHSVTKSIISTLIGIAIDRGDVDNVNDSVFEFFPEYSKYNDAIKSKISISHLLSLSSGLNWDEFSADGDWVNIQNQADPIRYILSKPATASPGSVFNYSEGDMILLGEIIKKSSNLNVNDYLKQYLLGPMGVQSFTFQTIGKTDVFSAGAGLWLYPRDMAKIGLMILQKGVWNDTQIVSEAWVISATQEQIDTDFIRNCDGYGYNWWLKSWQANSQSYDSYFAYGNKGNEIIVFPDLAMVIVITCDAVGTQPDYVPAVSIVPNYILSAVLD